ncbi:hypothetical protein VIC_003403 [Vibrio coralliilyticus ATCC BAA-450]|nr:hypothetical protein VIC_003403 [Vibrio coralliilyticus ATCC BAA-450]
MDYISVILGARYVEANLDSDCNTVSDSFLFSRLAACLLILMS